MSLMPAGARNPFTKMDKQSVIGVLKGTGSRDADVLHSQKNELLSPPKQLKLLGMICMGVGAFFTLTVILAIPMPARRPRTGLSRDEGSLRKEHQHA